MNWQYMETKIHTKRSLKSFTRNTQIKTTLRQNAQMSKNSEIQ